MVQKKGDGFKEGNIIFFFLTKELGEYSYRFDKYSNRSRLVTQDILGWEGSF